MRAQRPQATQSASPVSGSDRSDGSPRNRGAMSRFSSGYWIVTLGEKPLERDGEALDFIEHRMCLSQRRSPAAGDGGCGTRLGLSARAFWRRR